MPDDASQPPQPPAIPPRLRAHRSELVGICLIAILPLLALFGTFGPTSGFAHARSEELEIGISYPSRLRFEMSDRIDARVRNVGGRTLPEVRVAFDSGYLQSFSDVGFTPEAQRAHVVEIRNLVPGETRLVSVALKAERYGRNRGRVAASAGGAPVVLELGTLIFP